VTFEQFAHANLAGLLRLATVLTNDRALGEDLVQDVLERVQRRWDRISDLDEPNAYVRRMLVNEFVSWRRKWSRIVPRAEVTRSGMFGSEQVVPDPADAFVSRTALLDQVAILPRKQRAVIVLRYFQDMADAQIAETLGCTAATVRSQAMRALRTLRIAQGGCERSASLDTTHGRTT